MSRRLAVLAPLVAAATLLAGAAPAAHAVDCSNLPNLTDPAGFQWSLGQDGDVDSVTADVFGNTGHVYFDTDGDWLYFPPLGSECTMEDADREIGYPVADIGGVEVSGKVYVPSSGLAFVRHLWLLHNASATPRTIDLNRIASLAYDVDILTTSSGDEVVTAGDDWVTFDNQADNTDPAGALVWQGVGARRTSIEAIFNTCCSETQPRDPFADGDSAAAQEYQRAVLAPGETAAYLSFMLVRQTKPNAATAAAALAGNAAEGLAGLSDDEIRALRNFVPPDADRDGVANEADNCLNAVNADQADGDGDGQGDACDEDDDNDGVADALEVTLGTDPAKGDSDGDGKSDRDDGCPRTASTTASGCPAFDVQTNTIFGRLPPSSATARLAGGANRRLPFRFTVSGSILPPDGLSVQQACGSKGFVAVTVKRGRRTVKTRRAQLAADCTYTVTVRLASRRRIGRGRRSLKLTVRWLGNRFLEPRTVQAFTRKVG